MQSGPKLSFVGTLLCHSRDWVRPPASCSNRCGHGMTHSVSSEHVCDLLDAELVEAVGESRMRTIEIPSDDDIGVFNSLVQVVKMG